MQHERKGAATNEEQENTTMRSKAYQGITEGTPREHRIEEQGNTTMRA
jgi:hypothetical protein